VNHIEWTDIIAASPLRPQETNENHCGVYEIKDMKENIMQG
jgi:hypothetical protein